MVKKLFNVPRGCFNPSPNVDSAIVQFQAKPQADLAIDTAGFFDLVQGAFKQRRKTLYNNLKEYTGSAEQALNLLHEAGIGEQARAQELGTEEMIRLYRCYRGM
jgi:16S rRNA (adenine1518-N6/adenine1519-N6)-dimethyltransferase